jgi:nucleoside-diphosphate-sugar epimerase
VGILGTLFFKQAPILPSNQNPLGALPSRFRRERVLIVGCGDVGLRVARQLGPRVQVLALTSHAARVPELRALGIRAMVGNLDHAATMARLSGLATRVIHLAPPPSEGWSDTRTHALVQALRLRQSPVCAVYASTSGVYGDCSGDWVSETRTVSPHTPRAHRRVDAENRIRFWGRSASTRVSILRIPGIYANDRDGGTPRARLQKGVPVLRDEDDVYTNHIHADDLARAVCLTLWRGAPQRTYNVNDDTCLKMGDYFDLAADLYQLPRPPRIARSAAADQLPLILLSFMSESRRMNNTRMKRELGLRLIYPTVGDGLALSSAAPPHRG